MAQNTAFAHRTILIRCLAALALVAIYIVGATTLIATTATTAEARGRGRGRGRAWGRGRGRGRGWGRGVGIYVAPPVYRSGCYWSRRWRRTVCPAYYYY